MIVVLKHLSLFCLLLAQLHVESGLLLVLLFVRGKGSPREFDWHLTLVHNRVVLVRVESNARGVHVNVGLREVYVVIVRFSSNGDHGL